MDESSLVSYNQNGSSIINSVQEESSSNYSDADRLAFVNDVLNLLRTRNASMSAKLRQNINTSRSIAGATMIENDNKLVLSEYIFFYLVRTLHESVFQFAVNSSLMRDIYWQYEQAIHPVAFPKPVSDVKTLRKNKKIIGLMYEVENRAAEYRDIEKECDLSLKELLDVRSMYEEANDRFQVYRDSQRVNESTQSRLEKGRNLMRKKKMKMIASINKINIICSNLLTLPVFNLEDTKVSEMIFESRDILTERSLREESRMYNNVSQMNRIQS
ncbi:hypothetical protein LSTR_LSTR000801 [Laodelphax striatellus]|uniref:Uncharacterized protein n=1 Tax=Laodelphax striatellus TaxID=195883 RepID=A0A482XH68_LAOST|nr:hypothetical protein LSTR_LSTR000801 [Laodelphax striatellus]